MSTTATRSLEQALKLTQSDLDLVLEHIAILLPQNLHQKVRDVYPDIKRRIGELREELLAAPDSIDEQLSAAGLTGGQLNMKLDAHLAASDRAHKARPPLPGDSPIVFRKIFKSLLGWINVWLGSLVAVFGRGEAIKEFKEFLEQGVDDAENLG